MIFAFKYMYMLLGVRNLDKFVLHKLFLNKRTKIQDGCQSFPIIAATKTARVTLTFWNKYCHQKCSNKLFV